MYFDFGMVNYVEHHPIPYPTQALEEIMDKEKVNQLAKEMTELCQNGARSAVLFAGSPTGKALYMVVLTVLLQISPTNGELRFWFKPPINVA